MNESKLKNYKIIQITNLYVGNKIRIYEKYKIIAFP